MSYQLTMTQEQLDFWHALLAPFQDHELSQVPRGGKTLTYVDKRALDNRLDLDADFDRRVFTSFVCPA